ncbi:GvpL/GvpF family gas vesicle protein [Streptomyces sp. SP18ES09]|uniref:GvpL/GvpF family gas vesicle protein n=1 Tax=Streptomyces sp. SP18ES09 TaxID=3002532 RepID=UPI002E774F63|nr:GvpL/GvpF family gas vesicle protein [Streptomyces sp. SP18ES09]MEE1820233.1 GvpL/GvpF family gas vesicle protein [Streptomyces sp. SP18ES09]
MTTYVYGIAPADQRIPDGIEGVGDPPRPVRAVRSGDLVALCSDAPTELVAKHSDLLAHQHVVIEAGRDGTVLPLRFGEVSPDDENVAAILDERHDHYLHRMEEVAGKDEFNVKVHHDGDAVRQVVLADEPQLMSRHAGGEENTPFGELVARAVAVRGRSDAALVERVLGAHAAAVARGPQAADLLADLWFLVERERRREFEESLRGLLHEHAHLRTQATGPLPPYSFADTD